MRYTVGEVAKLAHVTVRALHHYDELGLVVPSERSDAGYRLYTESDLAKLQQVAFFRELGLSLDDIARVLGDPKFDREAALVTHRALLIEKGERVKAMLGLVDKTLDAMKKGIAMKPNEMFEGFDPTDHEEEARQRWGTTDTFAESRRRTARYSKADWAKMRAEMDALHRAFATAMGGGLAATDSKVLDLAENSRLHIDRWFYSCSREMHRALGRMYVDDPRFAANYEKLREGLAQYVCDAIAANAER